MAVFATQWWRKGRRLPRPLSIQHRVYFFSFLWLFLFCLFFVCASILPASRQGLCTRLTSCACVSLLFQYHHGIRPTASHHYNTESNICRQFRTTIWPDRINTTLTPCHRKRLRIQLALQLRKFFYTKLLNNQLGKKYI